MDLKSIELEKAGRKYRNYEMQIFADADAVLVVVLKQYALVVFSHIAAKSYESRGYSPQTT